MSRFKITCLLVCVLTLGVFANTAFAKKVAVVCGVANEELGQEAGYTMVFDGIKESFQGTGNEIDYYWTGLSGIKDAAQKEAAGAEYIAKIKAAKTDLVITLSDDCLRHVGLKIDDTPVVFAYVFGNIKTFTGLPKPNISGVTRRSYAGDIWGLANKLLGVKTVALISKHSNSMEGVRKYLFALADKLEAGTGVRYKEMYLVNTFDEWKQTVNTFSEDFIYLADTSRITDGDKTLGRADVSSWTVANSKVPVIASSEPDVAAGALYSIVTSEKAIGSNAGEIAKKILAGTPPSDIKYVQSKKGKLVVNIKTAQKYKVEIPYDILSSAEKVYE